MIPRAIGELTLQVHTAVHMIEFKGASVCSFRMFEQQDACKIYKHRKRLHEIQWRALLLQWPCYCLKPRYWTRGGGGRTFYLKESKGSLRSRLLTHLYLGIVFHGLAPCRLRPTTVRCCIGKLKLHSSARLAYRDGSSRW